MEKAVCPVRYSFVAVNTTRTNDADRGLGVLHRSCLYRRGVCTKKNIGRTLYKECVLHIASRVVFGKIQC